MNTIKLDDSWSGSVDIRVICPDCCDDMCADIGSDAQDSWNVASDLCVLAVVCPNCNGTGSLNVNLKMRKLYK